MHFPEHLIPARPTCGMVCIVGAGPGAADLLTLRAYARIQQADVVVHDRLIDPSVLQLIPAAAQCFYAGKAAGKHHLRQAEINNLLIEQAQAGRHVVRLKGGDPCIFGRGGEEVQSLQQHNIACEVIPGITAAQGCATVAGIPLTHRDHASSCIFLPGHLTAQKESACTPDIYQLHWRSLAQPHQTLVFYMAIQRVKIIATQLIQHGLPADTPAAIIQNGTRSDQKIWAAPLQQLVQQAPAYGPNPGLLIIGSTVSLSPAYSQKNQP